MRRERCLFLFCSSIEERIANLSVPIHRKVVDIVCFFTIYGGEGTFAWGDWREILVTPTPLLLFRLG